MHKQKTALVLSGGGALGAAHIGVYEKLLQKEYEIDFVVGVSAGAIVGACIACGHTPERILEILRQTKVFSLAFDFSLKNVGILKGDKVFDLLESVFEGKQIEDLDIPFYVGVTNFSTGERVLINKGSLAKAVRASLSVPVLFEPFYHDEMEVWFVDGGLSQNFPLDTAIEKYEGDSIYAVDVSGNVQFKPSFDKNKSKISKNLQKTLQRNFQIMFKNQQVNFKPDARVKLVLPDLEEFTPFDILEIEKMIEQGKSAMN